MTRRRTPSRSDLRRDASAAQPAHLPRFLTDDDSGLGDVIKRVTHAIGITACGACERRAATLNRWFRFNRSTRNDSTSRS
jgi:hypothetical protein